MREAPLWPLVVAFVATLCLNLVVAYRLRLLAAPQGIDVSTPHAMRINLATTFWALFLPAGNLAGIAVRFYKLSRAGGRAAGGVVTLIYDRVLGTAGLGLIGLICLAFDARQVTAAALGILVLGTAIVLVVAVPWVVPPPALAAARGRMGRVGALATLGSARVLGPGPLLALLGLSVVSQAPGVASFVVLARALDVHASVAALGWIRSVVLLLTLVPITLAGFGVREGAILLLLRFTGAPEHNLLALSLLVFATTALAPGLVGVLWDGLVGARST
jgi:glycosyltransferase 2 family protein